jgi:putative ABC transport system permease protein
MAHKRRLVGTFLAVVIGIGFFSGVSILTATVNQTFNDLFANGNKGTDAFVRSTNKLEVEAGPGTFTQRGRIDASLLDTVSAVDGVKDAKPVIRGNGRIVTASGKALGQPGNGPPALAEAWVDDPVLEGWSVAEGRSPEKDGEVVIDRKSAKDGNVKVGDKVTIQLTENVDATVVGIVTYAGEDSAGGASFVGFTLDQAERAIVGQPGQIDGIRVVGTGLSQQELVDRIKPALPASAEVLTGTELIKESQDEVQKAFLGFFNILLTAFGIIAVVVAVFSIYNTFSIIVAQRAREMALLRAIGAARAQVLRSVLLEALLVGLTASIVGVIFGFFVALGLRAMMSLLGFALPASSLTVTGSIIVTGIIIGTVISVLAGLVPAIRATRIPPLAALRDVAIERTKPSRVRIVLGAAFLALGLFNVLAAGIGKGDNAGSQVGIGAVLTLIGFVVFGPIAARPMSRALGSPLGRVRGITGSLAQQNAMRNPRRTSGSAMALMIGVGIVAFFTVFASSIKATIDEQIDKSFAGDLVIDSGQFGGGGVTPQLARDVRAQSQVEAAAGLRFGFIDIGGSGKQIVVSDPSELNSVLDLGVTQGSLADLSTNQLAVGESAAKDNGWTVGTKLPVKFIDGTTSDFEIVALFKNADVVNSNYFMSTAAWAPHALQDFDALVAVKLKDGVSVGEGKSAIKPLVDKEAAGAKLQTRDEFRDAQAGQINQVVTFVYAMLGVAIIISLMGIANTLSLSINERIREIGLMRAVGMMREQLRATIRWEAVIIALFGTLGGLGFGVLVSWSLAQVASSQGGVVFRLPIIGLVVLVVLGAAAGVVSAILPARRAAKLNVLDAIATD